MNQPSSKFTQNEKDNAFGPSPRSVGRSEAAQRYANRRYNRQVRERGRAKSPGNVDRMPYHRQSENQTQPGTLPRFRPGRLA